MHFPKLRRLEGLPRHTEINNPMAVVNEKAGLMKDLIEFA
jgi:hypothetical protein